MAADLAWICNQCTSIITSAGEAIDYIGFEVHAIVKYMAP